MVDARNNEFDVILALSKAADRSGSYRPRFIGLDAWQGVKIPGLENAGPRGTRPQGTPRLPPNFFTAIVSDTVSAIPASSQSNLPFVPPTKRITYALSKRMSPYISSSLSPSLFSISISTLVWPLLYGPRQVSLGGTTKFEAVILLLFRANG